jgi:hypothetical protein
MPMCVAPCNSAWLLRNLRLHQKSTQISLTRCRGRKHGEWEKDITGGTIWYQNPYLEENRMETFIFYHFSITSFARIVIFVMYLLRFGGSCAPRYTIGCLRYYMLDCAPESLIYYHTYCLQESVCQSQGGLKMFDGRIILYLLQVKWGAGNKRSNNLSLHRLWALS